jgi:hypothetical protein
MSKTTMKVLNAADALAEFANLEPASVNEFRQRWTDFVPAECWTKREALDLGPIFVWKILQSKVRDAWGKQFPSESTIDLISTVARESDFIKQLENVTKMTNEEFHQKNRDHSWAKPEAYPFQSAVMLLTMEPWRAKVCEECGNRFVADHAKRKYCSVSGPDGVKCSAKVIKRTHLEWGRENNWGRQ